MPGIPKSKACQPCKARRIKCDQNWPTCSPCKRKNIECPGASSLTKFYSYGDNIPKEQADIASAGHSTAKPADGPSTVSLKKQQQQQRGPNSMIHWRTANAPVGDSSFHSFRLVSSAPAPNLTTVADRVASRLVAHLDRGRPSGVVLQMRYLEWVPNRLSESAALRDCVGVLVHAWTRYRRGQPREELFDPAVYGKALRTLRRTLLSDQALTVETLTAITVLDHTEKAFGFTVNTSDSHAKGIQSIISRRGLPKIDDQLETGLVIENYSHLLNLQAVQGGDHEMAKAGWGRVKDKVITEVLDRDDFRHVPRASYMFLNSIADRWPMMMYGLKRISADPYTEETMAFALKYQEELHELLSQAKVVIGEIRESSLELGGIIETADPESLFGLRKDCKSINFSVFYIKMLGGAIMLETMLYQVSVVYEIPDRALWSYYRDLSVEIWTFVPYLQSLDTIAAKVFLMTLYVTYEAAEGKEEQDYVLESIRSLDRYHHEIPRDEGLLAQHVIDLAKYRTARS